MKTKKKIYLGLHPASCGMLYSVQARVYYGRVLVDFVCGDWCSVSTEYKYLHRYFDSSYDYIARLAHKKLAKLAAKSEVNREDTR